MFTGRAAGSAAIQATAGFTPAVPSGAVTVTTATGVDDGTQPLAFALHQNAPNPFELATLSRFTVPKAGRVSLRNFDVHGRDVATLVDGERAAGGDWDRPIPLGQTDSRVASSRCLTRPAAAPHDQSLSGRCYGSCTRIATDENLAPARRRILAKPAGPPD